MVSTQSEVMLVRCYVLDCDSGLLDIGKFDDIQKLKVKRFKLTCGVNHQNTYEANNIMRESDWLPQYKEKPYVNRRKEFLEEQQG